MHVSLSMCKLSKALMACMRRSQKLRSQHDASASKAQAELPAARTSLHHALVRLQTVTAQRNELAAKTQAKAFGLGCLASARPGSPAPPAHRMLHECFQLRDPGAFDRSLLQALDVIMGEYANSCVLKIQLHTVLPFKYARKRRGEAGHCGGGEHTGGGCRDGVAGAAW